MKSDIAKRKAANKQAYAPKPKAPQKIKTKIKRSAAADAILRKRLTQVLDELKVPAVLNSKYDIAGKRDAEKAGEFAEE